MRLLDTRTLDANVVAEFHLHEQHAGAMGTFAIGAGMDVLISNLHVWTNERANSFLGPHCEFMI